MRGSVETTVWADESTGSYGDKTGVKEGTIEVDVNPSPNSAGNYQTMLDSWAGVLFYT